jgi:vesicle-fusing ATPase
MKAHEGQILQVGQLLLVDYMSQPPIMFTVRALRTGEAEKGPQDPRRPPRTIPQGVVTRNTQINIVSANIPLMPTEKEAMGAVAAGNTILRSNFRFEELGIGGLDNEFAIIFRRAFASRLFPPSLTQRMGIKHVRGLLLYGPPGTGKTLIARQIGKTLNAREPKIINGPEILNKYVGQSEENVRKVFADAEKEYKEKGDNSKLHVIIFDELDAVCKQRGTGSTGGAGVGDTIVNQLLTKLDGVDELNNLLLIGMTNRKDMIDEALLRPGRLEVHLEIGLPDERGRLQILSIHTANLRNNKFLDRDVDLAELAKVTQNYSGAEISGLVRSASSFAFYRHTGGTTSSPEIKDLEKVVVNRADFIKALEETPPMFGVSETDLKACFDNGIIDYSDATTQIFKTGRMLIEAIKTKAEDRIKLRLMTVLLHGPDGSGKTAIAAKLAITSGIPFIKFISRSNMDGLSEMQKVQLILKIFSDADKVRSELLIHVSC